MTRFYVLTNTKPKKILKDSQLHYWKQ